MSSRVNEVNGENFQDPPQSKILATPMLTMNGQLFVGKIHVQNRNIVGNSVRKLAYDIPEIHFSTF